MTGPAPRRDEAASGADATARAEVGATEDNRHRLRCPIACAALRRWSALGLPTRIALIALLCALLPPVLLWPMQGAESNISHAYHWWRGDGMADSWGPVANALAYFDGDRSRGLYQVTYFESTDQFLYPPPSLLLFQPFRSLSGSAADFTATLNAVSWWVVLAIAGLTALVYVRSTDRFAAVTGAVPAGTGRRERIVQIAAVAAATLLFYPIVKGYTLGQVQTWITFLFAGAVLAWLWGGRAVPGALVGLICLIKPQLGLLVLWAALRREWRFAAGWAVVVGGLGLVSLWVYGLAPHLDYLRLLWFLQDRGESFYASHSVNSLMNRLLFIGPNLEWDPTHSQITYDLRVHLVSTASTLILLGTALFWRISGRGRVGGLELGIAGLSITMASPIAYEHHYGVLAPILAVLGAAMAADPRTGRGEWAALAVAYVLAAHFFPITQRLADTPFNVLQSTLLFGGIAVLVLLYRLGRRWSRRPAAVTETAPV